MILAHLYPEQMNIYGDRGNVLALVQRCAWRGIDLRVLPVHPGDQLDWQAVDLAFFGGGQDSGQSLIAADFLERQGPGLRNAVEDGMPLLAICGGYQLLGHAFVTHTGEAIPGLGLFDLKTLAGKRRLIGNLAVQAELDEQTVTLIGFENHSGRTYLGNAVRPLGRVLSGFGNNGEDRTEGAIYRHAIGCYMHGSLLPKNPQLADWLLLKALQRRNPSATLLPLDDRLELRAQQTMAGRLNVLQS